MVNRIKTWFMPEKIKSTVIRIIAGLLSVLIIISVFVYLSPKKVAERYARAAVYDKFLTLEKLTAYDLREYTLGSDYEDDEELFFEDQSDFYEEDITSWKSYSKVLANAATEELEDDYGEFKLYCDATRVKEISIKKLEDECYWILTRLRLTTDFDFDAVKDAKVVYVKLKLDGEDDNYRETLKIYEVKINGLWKVLDFDVE